MTMCYVVIGLGTIFSGLVMRRDPTSGLTAADPVRGEVAGDPGRAARARPPSSTSCSTGCSPSRCPGCQWLACIGLALVLPLVVEVDKWIRRRRLHPPAPVLVEAVRLAGPRPRRRDAARRHRAAG